MAIKKFEGIGQVDKRRCRVCGCTQFHACPGGCYWVKDDLCNQCIDSKEAANEFIKLVELVRGKRFSPTQCILIRNHLKEAKDNPKIKEWFSKASMPEIFAYVESIPEIENIKELFESRNQDSIDSLKSYLKKKNRKSKKPKSTRAISHVEC